MSISRRREAPCMSISTPLDRRIGEGSRRPFGADGREITVAQALRTPQSGSETSSLAWLDSDDCEWKEYWARITWPFEQAATRLRRSADSYHGLLCQVTRPRRQHRDLWARVVSVRAKSSAHGSGDAATEQSRLAGRSLPMDSPRRTRESEGGYRDPSGIPAREV
jgi:hypothetical protein